MLDGGNVEEKARRHFERIEEELMHAVDLGSSKRVAYQCGRLDAQRDERWWFIRLFAFAARALAVHRGRR